MFSYLCKGTKTKVCCNTKGNQHGSSEHSVQMNKMVLVLLSVIETIMVCQGYLRFSFRQPAGDGPYCRFPLD